MLLDQWKIIICSRYAFSGVAYALIGGVAKEEALSLDRHFLIPSGTIFFDIDAFKLETRFDQNDYYESIK